MEKYIPFEKRSKKQQREEYAKRRGTWGGLNPVTRRPEKKAYNRKETRKRYEDSYDDRVSYLLPKSAAYDGKKVKMCYN